MPDDALPSGEADQQTVKVDDELEEAVNWIGREIQEARRALWDGKSGKAFTAIEAAEEEFETVMERVLDD